MELSMAMERMNMKMEGEQKTHENDDVESQTSHSSEDSFDWNRKLDRFNLPEVPRTSYSLPLNAALLNSDHINSSVSSNLKPVSSSLTTIKRPAFVVVDPWSTGTRLCTEIVARHYDLIVVFPEEYVKIRSKTLPAAETIIHETHGHEGPHYESNVSYMKTVTTLKALRNTRYDIVGVVPGSETGVILAEKLAFTLGLPTNTPTLALARRNKYLMAETLRAKGVRAVKQVLAFDLATALNFIRELDLQPEEFKIIMKPNMGAGSDDVYLCKHIDECEKAFAKINGKTNSLGLTNEGVLVQEFLDGVEYVVDTVTVHGKHRVVSLWQYDKREVNGRFNVYFGNFPMVMAPGDEVTKQLGEYILQVLDALEFSHGPAHAEIKMTKTGPCLVEIGARCHGGNGTWVDVATSCWGLDQISCIIDSFTRPNHVPNQFPTQFKKFGVVMDLIAYETGEITQVPGEEIVRNMKSFHHIELYKKVGDSLVLSVDCNTEPGQVVLIHESEEQVRRDYEEIHRMLRSKNEFFTIKH